MKFKTLNKDTKGQLDINLAVTAILGLVLASAFLIIGVVVLQGVVDGGDVVAATTATTTYSATGVSVFDQIITIGSETYTVANTTAGAFYLTIGDNMTADLLSDKLLAEITANSTLVTAGAGAGDTVTITSILSGAVGNYASTENMTNGAFPGTTMTGGVNEDTLYGAMAAITDDIGSAMALAGTLILVIIGVAILMLLAGVMIIMKQFR